MQEVEVPGGRARLGQEDRGRGLEVRVQEKPFQV